MTDDLATNLRESLERAQRSSPGYARAIADLRDMRVATFLPPWARTAADYLESKTKETDPHA